MVPDIPHNNILNILYEKPLFLFDWFFMNFYAKMIIIFEKMFKLLILLFILTAAEKLVTFDNCIKIIGYIQSSKITAICRQTPLFLRSKKKDYSFFFLQSFTKKILNNLTYLNHLLLYFL